MSQDQWVVLAFKVVLVVVVAAIALFVAVYSYLSPWRTNPIGRTVVDFAVLVGAGLVPPILSLYFHLSRTTSAAAGWVDIGIFAWIAWKMLRRIPLWVKLHRGKDQNLTYDGLGPFLAEVIRRRGRPLWMDAPPPDTEAGS